MASNSLVIPEAARGMLTLLAISSQVLLTSILCMVWYLIISCITWDIEASVKAPLSTWFYGDVNNAGNRGDDEVWVAMKIE